jgi:hypothetical protein
MGWLDAIGAAFSWLGGEGFGAALARIAIGLGISKLLQNNQENAANGASSSTPRGQRQQISPATDNKVPVAYGDSYFSGTITDVQLTNANKQMFAVLNLCEKTGDIYSTNPGNPASRAMSSITIDDIYISNQKVTFMADGTTVDYTTDDTGVVDTNLHGLVGIYLYQGSSNSPMLPCITGTTTPIAGTTPAAAYSLMPGWDNTYTMENYIFAVVEMNYDPSKGAHTIPQIKFHVRNTMNKPGDVLIDYATNLMYGAGLTEEAIDLTSITNLNTYSDELVTYGTYPAQPRYRINGLVRTTETVLTVMEKIAATAGSDISYDVSTGKWAVLTNKPVTKTLDFNDNNIIGQINLTSSNLDSYYNQIEVQFPYAILKDQFNYVRVNLPAGDLNQNENPNMYQLTHELTNNLVQASILANLDLRQSREDLLVTFNTDYSKYNIQIGDVFGVTNSVYGWAGKQFKVIRVKKTESDAGQLTVEITGLAYNPSVFTVSDISTFVPSTGIGHSLPSLSPIATPEAPTVNTTTISSQPSISITGIIPTGVVTEMEFWYTKDTDPVDDNRKYTMLGVMRAENSGPFLIGVATVFKTVLLASGTYYFKVRAVNESGSSKFSLPSVATPYTYVQTPDALPYHVPVVDSTGAAVGGMSLGLMAGYLATKLNWFGPGGIFSGNATLASIFGLSNTDAASIDNAVNADTAAQNGVSGAVSTADAAQATATNAMTAATNAESAASQATSAAAQASADAAAAKAAAEAVGGVLSPHISVEDGKVFPSVFGDGPTPGASTHAGIFTHDNLVFSGSLHTLMKPENVVSAATTLKVEITGKIQNFYTIPGSTSWAKPPLYTQTIVDKFEYNSKLCLYYSTATYAGGALDAQSWSPWTLINCDNGVRGTPAGYPTSTTTYTNPYVDNPDYIVDEIYDVDAFGFVILGTAQKYDPFKPNIPVTVTTYADRDTRQKELWLTVGGSKAFSAGTSDLITFGTSPFNLPSGTPFAGNTAFGHVDVVYRQVYPNALSFREMANNGSRFVAIQTASDKVYWSDDGALWNRVEEVVSVTTNPAWIDNEYPFAGEQNFLFLVFDGSKFIVYQNDNSVATSSDGKVWTEFDANQGIDKDTTQVIADSGHYLTIGPAGIQTSTDGINWSAPSQPAAFEKQQAKCGCWDGSKFIVGATYIYGQGSAMFSSADGTTWAKMNMFNKPSISQLLSESQTAILNGQTGIIGGITSALPI